MSLAPFETSTPGPKGVPPATESPSESNHSQHNRPPALHTTSGTRKFRPRTEPKTSGGTPLQRFLPRQLLVSSPFVQSPSGEAFTDGMMYFPYSPASVRTSFGSPRYGQQGMSPQMAQIVERQGTVAVPNGTPVVPGPYFYYDYGSGQYIPPGQQYCHPYNRAMSSPNLRHRKVPSRKLLSSLSKVTLSDGKSDADEEEENLNDDKTDPNLSKVLAKDAEADCTDENNAVREYPASPSPLTAVPAEKEEDGTEGTSEESPAMENLGERTVVLENLRSSLKAPDILDIIEFGPIENCTLTKEKGGEDNNNDLTARISFISSGPAGTCFSQLKTNLENLKGVLESPDMKIKLTEGTPIEPEVRVAIENFGATRAICISNLPKGISQKQLSEILGKFGEVETIQYKLTRNCAFVHFTSIKAAIDCMVKFSTEAVPSAFSDSALCYAPDKNAFEAEPPMGFVDTPYASSITGFPTYSDNASGSFDGTSSSKSLSPSRVLRMKSSDGRANSSVRDARFIDSRSSFSFGPDSMYVNPAVIRGDANIPMNGFQGVPLGPMRNLDSGNFSVSTNIGNRTIYLGNLDCKTTEEDICNAVRGGMLESVHLLRNRRVCFITFINSEDAAGFMARSQSFGFFVHSRCLHVDWGHNSGPLSSEIRTAVQDGASRNLYIGIIREDDSKDLEEKAVTDKSQSDTKQNASEGSEKLHDYEDIIPNEEILRRDFSFFGGIEQINFFEDHRCAFVNFFNIRSCVKAVHSFNSPGKEKINRFFKGRYEDFKIAYGKDRCAGPPKKKKKKKKKRRGNNGDNDNKQQGYSNQHTTFSSPSHSQLREALGLMQIQSKMLEEKESNETNSSWERSSNGTPLLSGDESELSGDSSARNRRKPQPANKSQHDSRRSSRAHGDSEFLPDNGTPYALGPYASVAYSPVPYYSGDVYNNVSAGRPAIRMNNSYSISSPQLLQQPQGGYYVYGPQLYYPMYPAAGNDDVEYTEDSTENERDSKSNNSQDEDERTIQDDNNALDGSGKNNYK
ncbi:DEBR0S4_14400g1_1 [Brettanomyces bruxellensis]|uniref:DEBR0S4_14400g1_1 n=1 Tax=Dekkera bruxellensis TaxID=5007 RepID=A0A7D9H1J1_DEKBR|nr:DEBR0S4_14400g1_1 [Brettanomyces bruxellensis]